MMANSFFLSRLWSVLRSPKVILGSGGIFLLFFYLFWVSVSPRDVFWSLDEGGKYIYLRSILESGELDTPLLYPSHPLDPFFEFVPLYYSIRCSQNLCSWWPIALPLFSLPFYRAFGWLGLFLLPAIAGALTAWLSGVLVRRLGGSVWMSWLVITLTGLATPVAFYATRFWEHTISTAGVLGALLGLLDADEHQRVRSAVIAGISGSLAVFFRSETVFLLIGFGIVLLLRRPYLALCTALSAGLVSLPWMVLNMWTAGHPFGPTFSQLMGSEPFSGWQKAGLKFLAYIMFNPPRSDAFILPHWALRIASFSLFLGVVLAFFPRLRWLSLIAFGGVIGICGWVTLYPMWYQAVHGVVLAAPQVLFGLYYLVRKPVWRQSAFPAMLTASLLLYGTIYFWRAWLGAGGLQWGPRYLLSFYPLLMASALLELSHLPRKKPLFVGMVLMFVVTSLMGLIMSIRGLMTARTLTGFYARSLPAVTSIRNEPIIMASKAFAMNVPALYFQGNVLSTGGDEITYQKLITRLRENGFRECYVLYVMMDDNAPLEVIAERLKKYPSGVVLTHVDLTEEHR